MAQLTPIYVIGLGTSAVMLYQSLKLARAGKENVLEFLLWTSFGVGLLVYTLARVFTQPGAVRGMDSFLTSLGFESGERGLLVLSIISLYLIVLYSYTLTKTNEKRLSDVHQELALLRYEIEQLNDRERRAGTDGGQEMPGEDATGTDGSASAGDDE